MLIAAFALFSAAALLGGILLTPALPAAGPYRRPVAAAVHGSLGGAGLATLAWGLSTAPKISQITWSGSVLVAMGFVAGLVMLAMWRQGRPPPAIVLPLHVIFAGLGYVILAGLVLTQ